MDEKYLQDFYNRIVKKDPSYQEKMPFETFKVKIQDEAYNTKMQNWLGASAPPQNAGVDIDAFLGKKPVKKKEPSVSLQRLPEQEPTLASSSEDVSSASSSQSKNYYQQLGNLTQGVSSDNAVAPITKEQVQRRAVEVDKENAATPQRLIDDERKIKENEASVKLKQKEDAKKAVELDALKRAEALGNKKDAEFLKKLSSLDSKFIKKDEEDAVTILNKQFSSYGFLFTETGAGDALIVQTTDGKHSIEIDLQPFSDVSEITESSNLRDFLSNYGTKKIEKDVEKLSFLSKSLKAQNARNVAVRNPDGTESTVKFTSYEEDGKNFVVPTLFPIDPSNYTSDPKTWKSLGLKEAIALAKERNEVYSFDTAKEADEFAKGSWKDVTTLDVEADKFYQDRGHNYEIEKKNLSRLEELNNVIEVVEGKGSMDFFSIKTKYPDLFINGKIRTDADEYIKGMVAERDALEKTVNDYSGWGSSDDRGVERTRDLWDLQLSKRSAEISSKAASMNMEAKMLYENIDNASLEKFNVPIEELIKYRNTDPSKQADFDKLLQLRSEALKQKKVAASRFDESQTYLDEKTNKLISSELVENAAAFYNSNADAWNNGQIGATMLKYGMGMTGLKESAEDIAKRNAGMTGTQSYAMARMSNAETFMEGLMAFGSDPFEIMLTAASNSISSMLPVGVYIIPASVATGTVIGAGVGSTGAGVGAIPGGIAGAGYGFRTGMALTNGIVEYNTALMDAVSEMGYNPLDPESLMKALEDQAVWDKGRDVGLARGIPITAMDYITGGLAGRLIKPQSMIASTASKAAHFIGERVVLDTGAEMLGEATAQASEMFFKTGREKFSGNEIVMEGIGHLGMQAPNALFNIYKDTRNNTNIDIAKNFTDISIIASESASDGKITAWANNMQKLGKIDADVNKRIQDNVALRIEARDMMSVGTDGAKKTKVSSDVVGRTMELLVAREELSSSPNRRAIYGDKITAINKELSTIAETKKVLPTESAVDLGLINARTTQKDNISEYTIDKRRFTKEQFIDRISKFAPERFTRAVLGVKNDEETARLVAEKTNLFPNTEEEVMPIEEIFENADSESLKNKESTAKALESLAADKTEGSIFTDNEGNALPVVGNENTLSELYHEAVDTPMEQRTEAQNSAMDVVKKSLNEKVKLEKIFVEDTAPTQDDSRSASNKSDMGDMKGRVKGQAKVKVIESAQRAIKTLKSILPNFDIHIHEDEGSYNAAMQKVKGESGSKGNFYSKGDGTGRIDINLSRASATTVAHEVAHGVMLKVFGDNPALFKKFRENISKVLKDDKNKVLNEFADRYGDDVQHEEYLVQLTAILEQEQDSISTTTVQKIAAIINKVLSTISGGKIVAFQDITDTKELIDFLNKVSGSIREGGDIDLNQSIENLINQEPYSEGIAIQADPNAEYSPISKSDIGVYEDFPKELLDLLQLADVPINTLKEKIKEYGGRVLITTSDATGYGVDNKGRAIVGGYGFSLNKKNVDAGIGFANVNAATVKKLFTTARKKYGEKKVLVLIMIQSPDTTINNSYGVTYFIESLKKLKNLDNVKAVTEKFGNEKLSELIGSVNDKTDTKEFVKKFIDITTFIERKEYLKKTIPSGKSNRKGVQDFNDINVNIINFLKEYGDKSFMTPEMIDKNDGNFVVGGFEINVLSKEENNLEIIDIQGKGIEHPLFNAKVPGINHFKLDGPYDVQKNFEAFATPEIQIDYTKTTEEEITKLVNEKYSDDKYYKKPEKPKNYSNLKTDNKIIFKKTIPSLLKEVTPKIPRNVASGRNFTVDIKEIENIQKSKFEKRPTDGQSKSQLDNKKENEQTKKIPTATPAPAAVAGNRLFNKPISAVSEIAKRYYKRVFGKERLEYYGSRKLDKERAKRISNAFISMVRNPNDPLVKKSYEALAKETIEQYKEFLDAGYKVEINNNEPYANSQEMIDDLRNNKSIKIFSTESGFGDTAITDKQRQDNPLLKDSGLKDINGETMLVNDVFRAIHDFFGHAELGNSFGPLGEENAWNVHARMFSPIARRAMTTETRGQNSYVNFSGVNEKIDLMREQARELRAEGKESEAQVIVQKIYEMGSFADQSIGLIPEEFSNIDSNEIGDVSLQPQGLQSRDIQGTSKSQKGDNEKIATEKIQELGALLGVDLGKPFSKSQLSDSPLPKPVANSFDILKKKFGETAAKAIRENIPFALDYPNEFVDFLTKKIPSKDDIPFIVKQMGSRLDGLFRLESDKNIKTVETITKTPEELSKLAGYVFHRTESMDDVLVFKKDFANREVLCTYNDVQGRLKGHFIFWVRRNNAETVLPADKITQDYLKGDSEGAILWRGYLEGKGLKKDDGSYDLSKVTPSRQDPYGTSSMSVQVGRSSGIMSIKNRYNHTVSNPDATFGNDLNNIIDGLHDAVYAIEGVPKKSKQAVSLPDGIVSDAKGNFFRFDKEIDNVHFSQNGYMKEGVITIIDKSTQRMVDDYLVDLKSKQIKSVTSGFPLVDNINKISIEKNKISIDTTDGNLILDFKDGILVKLSGSITSIGDDFLANNTSLTSIELPNNTSIGNGFLANNTSLTSIELPNNTKIGGDFLNNNKSITSIELPKNTKIGSSFLSNNKSITSIELPNNKSIGNYFLYYNQSLTNISLPNNTIIGDDFLFYNTSLTSIELPNNTEIGGDFLVNNKSITSVSLPENTIIGDKFLVNNKSITSIELPNNKSIGNDFLYHNNVLTSIELPNNTDIGNYFLSRNKSITSIELPKNTKIGSSFLVNNTSLTNISLPNNTEIGRNFLYYNKSLTSIELPNNKEIGDSFLVNNTSLTSIELPKNKEIGGLFLNNNKSITSIELPKNTKIGSSFLSNNKSITSIELPNNKSIGNDFLFYNTSLTNISLPKNTSIGNGFLRNNESIKAQSKSQLTEKNISEMVKKARAEGLSDEAIRKRLLSNGISSSDIDIAMESTETSSSKIEVNEQRMPGYDAMLSKVRGIREKSAARGRSESDTNNSVMAYVMGSDVYKNASDVQREAIVRQIRKYFGLREKSAPKVTNLLDGDMVTVSSKVLVLEKIKALVRGGKDAVKAIKVAQEQLRKEIKELRKSGKITAAQLERVIGRLGKTDLLSPTATARFIDYMGKVFADAEYGQKISDAYKTRSQILSLTENEDKNINLRALGVEFAKIEPSMVEDIDAYNDMAKSIEEAIRGSKIKKDNTKFAASVRISSAMEYVKATLETQERLITEERIAEIQELMGIDATGFSAREMIDLLKSPEPLTKYNEPNIRALVSRAFDAYKSIIEQELESGIDAFTGEPVYYTAAERKAIREFMEMDTDKMPTAKEGLDAVDSLINFLANKSTAKMMSVTAKYNGQQNAKKVVAKKIESVKLKKLFMPGLARTLAEQTTNLNIVFEKMFKGFNRSRIVMEAMGLLDFINRKAYAQNKSKIIVSDYINTFYKKGVRPNGQAFNTAYNEIERGMAAFMMRNVIDSPEERAIEFDRRKRLIKQSIDTLSGGNEKEKKKGKLYEEAYNKIVVDAEGINDIIANTDKINLDAIDYWHRQWNANFEQMASTSIGIYNKILERESNFSPDRFSKVAEFKGKQIDLDDDESAYHTNNGTLYKRAAGSLQKAERPSNLGELNEKGELSKVEHYINLSFDRNNSNSMYDALVDIETAASIRQVQAFMNSDDFKKIVPYAEDRALLKNRIDLYIRKSRGKESYSDDELSKFMRGLNKVSTIGIGQALGGITQPAKQVIPIAFNTIINGGGLNVVSVFDKDFTTWLESIGMPISNRGIQSQTEVDNINAKIQEAADSKGEQLLNLIESANKQWLKIFLVAPDVFIARASWKGYYEKALAKQGIDIKGLDYSTHEVNMEAANYAQGMVDRQQNISDHDMSGKAFVSTEVAPQILVKSLMAFASFRMNAASRTAADLSTIGHWSVSTKEDKAIALKSLAGYAVEQAVFKSITVGISLAIGSLALSAMGKDEDDDEFEKRKNNLIKGAATGAVTDIFSPVPVTDKLIQDISVWTLDQTQSLVGVSDEDKLSLFGTIKESFLKGAGTFGIAIEKASQLIDLVDLSYSGTYIDDYGKEKKITEEDREALSMFILPAIMTNIGLAPSEVSSLVRNAVKSSKKAYKTDAERAESEQKDREEAKENREKINALVELRSKTSSSAEIEFINKKIRELNLEGEEKKEFKKAKEEENKIKNAKKELLLDDFENQSDMKKYAPEKWERNFGEGSEWYRENSAEMKVNKNLRKEEREEKEDLYNYVDPKKNNWNKNKNWEKGGSKKDNWNKTPSKKSNWNKD